MGHLRPPSHCPQVGNDGAFLAACSTSTHQPPSPPHASSSGPLPPSASPPPPRICTCSSSSSAAQGPSTSRQTSTSLFCRSARPLAALPNTCTRASGQRCKSGGERRLNPALHGSKEAWACGSHPHPEADASAAAQELAGHRSSSSPSPRDIPGHAKPKHSAHTVWQGWAHAP